jgi:tetratricopeptide (TPR) repeat protein
MATNDPHLTTGCQYALEDEYAQAIKEFDLLLTSDQTKADGLYYRDCAKLRLQQYRSAIDDFDSSILSLQLSSDHQLQALYKRGYAHYKNNQFDSALNDYRRFLTECENNPNDLKHKGYFGIGCVHATLNQHEQAVRCFGDAIDSSKDKGSSEDKQKLYHLYRGRALGCCARYSEAKDDLDLVIAQSKDRFVKGCAYNELGQHQLAVDQFDYLLENKAQTATDTIASTEDIRFRRGLSLASLNSHSKALEDYQYILERSKETKFVINH